jgi:cell wall-associated NlpC family hydrolase
VFKAISVEQIIRDKIIEFAILQKKKEYIHGSHGPDAFDCAGLVWYIYHEVLGINLYTNGIGKSTTTQMMTSDVGILYTYEETVDINKMKEIIPADILFFHKQAKEDFEPRVDNKYPGHCGIYLGNDSFIHCSRRKNGVIISNIDKEYWNRILVGSKNVIDDENIYKRVLKNGNK